MMSSLFYAHPNSPVALFSSTARIKALRTSTVGFYQVQGVQGVQAGEFSPPQGMAIFMWKMWEIYKKKWENDGK